MAQPGSLLLFVIPAKAFFLTVIPAKAGTHLPRPPEMGPRFRGDDGMKVMAVIPSSTDP